MDRSEIISEAVKSLKDTVSTQYDLLSDDLEVLYTAYGIAMGTATLIRAEIGDRISYIARQRIKNSDTGSED